GFSGSGASGVGGSGGAGYKPATMICPSSPLTSSITVTYTPASTKKEVTAQIVQPTYTGIAGAVARKQDYGVQTNGILQGAMVLGLVPGVNPATGNPTLSTQSVIESRSIARTGSIGQNCTLGHVGGAGVFIPNKAIGLAGITDGSSTTICIGEQ